MAAEIVDGPDDSCPKKASPEEARQEQEGVNGRTKKGWTMERHIRPMNVHDVPAPGHHAAIRKFLDGNSR